MAITQLPPAPESQASDDGYQSPHVTHGHGPSHGSSSHQHSLSNASTVTVDIEAWTVSALESLSIAPGTRGTGVALSIPLDVPLGSRDAAAEQQAAARMSLRGVTFDSGYGAGVTPPRRTPSARDSMKKRDALLKGKEGSRQRRRWENDHLLHVPNVQPPLPIDFQVHPTHRVLPPVPYQLAQYWDKGLRERVEDRKVAFAVARRRTAYRTSQLPSQHPSGIVAESTTSVIVPESTGMGAVPKDLRVRAKHTPAVKSLLRELEPPVRQFVLESGLATEANDNGGTADGSSSDETDPEDEEIVFVGRNLRTRDGKPFKKAKPAAQRGTTAGTTTGMVLDTVEGDAAGAFKRWLTHSISDYYGLESKSATVGNPARRVVYVGLKRTRQPRHHEHHHHHDGVLARPVLPPPLWEMF